MSKTQIEIHYVFIELKSYQTDLNIRLKGHK